MAAATAGAIAIGATANIIGTEADRLLDNVSHYIEEHIHGFIENHTTGKKRKRRRDLASITNDTTEHTEDVHRPDSQIPNDHEANTPVHSDGPNTTTGFRKYILRNYKADRS